MKFFFYGIFLDKSRRRVYGIQGNANYDLVKDYVTYEVANGIVMAAKVPNHRLALTGVVVEVPPKSIPSLDYLEQDYKRITVTTVLGETVQMYVAPGSEASD